MRQAIGTTTTFKAAFIFTIIFSAFLALAITYNKVFRIKNESIAIIEKYEGVSSKSLQIINNYLINSGYAGQGVCKDGSYGVRDLNTNRVEKAITNRKYYYCLTNTCTESCKKISLRNNNKIMYNIELFYKFNLPVIGDIFNYKISGKTKGIKFYDEKQLLSKNK